MPTVRVLEDLSPEWLSDVLGAPVDSFTTERIGTGQMSLSHRVSPSYADGAGAGPQSVVIKLAATDETSRATGIGLGIYEREVRFYEELAPKIGGPLPPRFASAFDPPGGGVTLVLEGAAPPRPGDPPP